MSKIKIAELFYSLQGEGKYMGVPSIFLRTFGCNFTCGGFGMPKGEVSNERDTVYSNIKQYKSYSELPLVSTGCDSYASWDTRFKNLSPMLTTDKIAEQIVELLPRGEYGGVHLVITGGEPLLGWQRAYPDLLDKLSFENITFETNGTQPLTEEFAEYLHGINGEYGHETTFSVSPKLSVSGESRKEAIKPEVVCGYQEVGEVYLKFVVATDNDVEEALEIIELYEDAGFNGHVYLMPVGGVESVYILNNRRVAELALHHGLRYSDRLQVPLFKNAWGT